MKVVISWEISLGQRFINLLRILLQESKQSFQIQDDLKKGYTKA